MKRFLLSTIAASAVSASMAAVNLVPSFTAPAELQLGEYEVYRLSVKNAGNTAATGVSVSLNLPAGMTPVLPLPPICTVNALPQLVCASGLVPAGKTRDYAIVFMANPSAQVFPHQARATGAGVAQTVSAIKNTNYQNFSAPAAGSSTQLWEMRSCGGSSPVAYNLCPTSSEVVGDAILEVGRNLLDLLYGSPGTWMQNPQDTLVLDNPAISGVQDHWSGTLKVINSRCFRGAGQAVPAPGTGGQIWYTANKICMR